MPCDTKLKPKQTLQERATEVRKVIESLGKGIAAGRVKVAVGPQGAVAFAGLSDKERDGVTDACMFRRIMVGGDALAKAALARAEQMSGRVIDRKAVAQGAHSHDNGATWHSHKG